MATSTPQIIGGVDTHRDLHVAAAIDPVGHLLGHRSFPATPAGYRALLAWLRGLGQLQRVGVEGTGAYGAGLLRHLRQARVTVVEVDRPDRRTRRRKGKSDPVDAEAAARAALAGTATGIPKGRDGRVEAIRALRVARRGAMKARTAAGNQLGCLVVSAPEPLRGTLRALSGKELVVAAAGLRPGPDLTDAVAATKAALRRVAHRYLLLSQEIAELDQALTVLVAKTAPRLVALMGVGTDVAGQLLVTAGDNPNRLVHEAAFAHLCGVAPLPVNSGRTTGRHRLSRGGDRAANNALYTIVISRLRWDPRTRAYMQRRTKQGMSKLEVVRCLKRYVAREVHQILTAPQPPERLDEP
jgi:transposase